MGNVIWVSLPDEIYLGNVRDKCYLGKLPDGIYLGNVRDDGTWEYYLGVST